MGERPPAKHRRIIKITLGDGAEGRGHEAEHERRIAIYELLERNRFALTGRGGPYHVHVAVREGRLVIAVRDSRERLLDTVQLPTTPFRRLMRDYFIVRDSYYESIKRSNPSRIEAIDVGRRSLHDEGAKLLRTLLAGKIDIDFDTGRRLFTLLTLFHVRG
jgi:uncharacterized protein (UPF0262 family)